jgi:hypothetical protein
VTTYCLYTKRRFSSPWRLAGIYLSLEPANDRLSVMAARGTHVGLRVERHEVTVVTRWGVET